MTRILVTGFMPFPGAPLNPTEWLIGALGRETDPVPGAEIVTRLLPTTYDVCESVLTPLVDELKPDAVVQFGLSAKADGFTLERTAYNMLGVGRPDSAGGMAPAPWIEPLGPGSRSSGLPLGAIATALSAAHLPWSWSDSAGDYMCNLVFYRMRLAMPEAPTGFIHLPYTIPMQEKALAAGAAMPAGAPMREEDMLAGAKIVLGAVAARLAAPAIA